MSKVLIADSDLELLESLDQELKQFRSQFETLTVSNGQDAIEIFNKEAICLLVAGLEVSNIDSFSILAHVTRNYSRVPCIVMVPYEIPEKWKNTGNSVKISYLQKPFVVNQLFEAILEGLDIYDEEELLNEMSVSDLFPLINMEKKTCILEVGAGGNEGGLLCFEKGVLSDAVFNELDAEQAALELISMKNPEIRFKDCPKEKRDRRLSPGFMSLILDGSRQPVEQAASQVNQTDQAGVSDNIKGNLLIEEENRPQRQGESSVIENQTINKGENNMAEIKEILQKFQSVDGFQAVGAFSPNGEMVAEVNPAGLKIDELGALANDVLLKAQKATEIMGVGRGQMVHVEAPKAHVVARCLNEATDFAATASGRAHVHMVVVLEKECNLAMAKMKVDGVIQEIAEFFR